MWGYRAAAERAGTGRPSRRKPSLAHELANDPVVLVADLSVTPKRRWRRSPKQALARRSAVSRSS